jgi:malate dehydrogenase (oxaloacetate-decarboxylating)
LDVGTNRDDLRADPGYLGVHEKRLTGDAYFNVLDKFVVAVKKRWPNAIIQWEDFAKDVAFTVLERYRKQIPSFNDDIQGTGAVVLAGLLSACKLKNESLADQRIIVVGAGAGGVGVAKVIQDGLVHEGLTRDQARKQMYILDEFGLVVEGISPDAYKKPIMQFKESYQNWQIESEIPTILEVIKNAKPTILLGLTGVSGLFTQEIIEGMAASTERPIIFPLSNPTDNVEAVPQDIFNWTKGTAIIASGSPFANVTFADNSQVVGQGNNAFIFPGLGFASVLGKCQEITDSMIIESAHALADFTAEHYLKDDLIYPPISDLHKVSMMITKRVLSLIIKENGVEQTGLELSEIDAAIEKSAWKPEYLPMKKG